MKVAAQVLLVLFVCCAASRAQEPAQPGSEAPGPQVIKMTAKKYVFDPGTITVTRGRPVRIEATALDRDHGIELKEFGVQSRLVKGKTTVIEFTPDKTGEFTFHCSVFCGLGHHGMKGTLIVVEPAKP
ncbi:MAG TPA: cupredoxin domain-containing protein [Blastocatellia bacterium]|nr:cupredoxin domain-containing protein [Blastocatellia bacterium]